MMLSDDRASVCGSTTTRRCSWAVVAGQHMGQRGLQMAARSLTVWTLDEGRLLEAVKRGFGVGDALAAAIIYDLDLLPPPRLRDFDPNRIHFNSAPHKRVVQALKPNPAGHLLNLPPGDAASIKQLNKKTDVVYVIDVAARHFHGVLQFKNEINIIKNSL